VRATLILAALCTGCVSTRAMQTNHAETGRLISQVDRAAAIRCSPVEYARAVANEDFARLEFKQGEGRMASRHVANSLYEARVAVGAVEACTPLDADGDGIPDPDDKCPGLPEDFDDFQDEDGCPELEGPDRDNDGITDAEDACPDQPEDLDGFMDSDGCPDLDNDRDGVLDVDDDCPTQPGPAPTGCPWADRDNDGIVDASDECPDEPETINDYADTDGCPDTPPDNIKVTRKQIVIEEQIRFALGSANIQAVSYGILDGVVQVLSDYPDVAVRVEGHTDNVGDDGSNQRLSEARAESVRDYLRKKGVERDRLEAKGYGETRPIDTNRTQQGRAKNRRVEFHIVDGSTD